jgi:hypothetical protein
MELERGPFQPIADHRVDWRFGDGGRIAGMERVSQGASVEMWYFGERAAG